MAEEQLDLFAGPDPAVEPARQHNEAALEVAALTDEQLIAVVPSASLMAAPDLAAEIARRRLDAAIPALEKLCRRLVGYGAKNIVPEQRAALRALAAIGGNDARQTVARLIVGRIVHGPTLGLALNLAAQLGTILPPARLAELLHDRDPSIRAAACRCVHTSVPAVAAALSQLLDDLHAPVANAAVCALGRIGRSEARPRLLRMLREAPSDAIIESVVPIADRDTIVILRRIARMMPDLAAAALAAVDEIGSWAASAGNA